MRELTPLDPKQEAELPEQIQLIRRFYFQLSEEDKKKLDNPEPAPVIQAQTSETKFCFECGHKIARIAKFCQECGTKQPDTHPSAKPVQSLVKAPTIQEIYSKEKLQQSDELDYFIRAEKARLLKKYDCNTIGEVIQKMEQLIKEKK